MSNRSEFKTEFVDNLSEVGEVLSQNGYDIANYTGNLKIGGVKAAGHANTPEQALKETLNDIDEDKSITVPVPGNKVRAVYEGEDPGLEEILYSNLTGSIEVEEPLVDWSKDRENMDQVDPSTDPTTNEQITAAFGLNIEYHPDPEQNGYWEVGSLGTAPTHTLEEAEQRVQNIAETLEENNIEYELGPIN